MKYYIPWICRPRISFVKFIRAKRLYGLMISTNPVEDKHSSMEYLPQPWSAVKRSYDQQAITGSQRMYGLGY